MFPQFSFHRAGWPFIAVFAVASVFLGLFSAKLFWLGVVATAWCAYFFRDPVRVTPNRSGLIIAPADGQVIAIREVTPEAGLGLDQVPHTRISIFLNVFDVHVNRVPADGVIRSRIYRPGKFVNASLDKASDDNERMALTLQLTGDHPHADKTIGFVQIAGLVARRIICEAQEGEMVKAGQRYGIIRFGSRADIYLPQGIAPQVIVGQRTVGGETVLADCASTEAARQGETR